jgi:cyclopropane fatty-acyl-phospholipid synthase-like methyltransferase
MIGQKIASLESPPRSWVQGIWGIPDIHTRQKWTALYPYLSRLHRSIRLLDAGCGSGAWSLELALLHPDWTVVGIDKDSVAINQAERSRRVLGLQNVTFIEADFLNFHPPESFDGVLSVASAHYLVEQKRGQALFDQFCKWLHPDGKLLLLGPRMRAEVPSIKWLPQLTSSQRDLYSYSQLTELCQQSGLIVEDLLPAVFFLGALAKQLHIAQSRFPKILNKSLYPLEWLLSFMDPLIKFPSDHSCSWVLYAKQSRQKNIM